ncbi:MAG: ATP-dependent helicase [Nitriliruptorales bacterium]
MSADTAQTDRTYFSVVDGAAGPSQALGIVAVVVAASRSQSSLALSADLDPEQRRAVEAVTGPVAVVAGPGSGKTRVTSHRIANQVGTGIVAPASVLAVTFTERAANELLVRLRRLGVPAGGRGVRAATFHSAALRQASYFWPRVADGAERFEVLPSKLAILVPLLGRRARIEPIDLATEIEWVKAQGSALGRLDLDGPLPRWRLEVAEYRAALEEHDGPWDRDDDLDRDAERFAAIFDRYEQEKAGSGRLDFEDLLAVARGLIIRFEAVREPVRAQYTHFTVDEFQDTNRLQWDLLEAWLGDRDDVCVVGDRNQAIYGFAGADPTYLDAFRTRFPHAVAVSLRTSYRSTQPVLDLATNALWGSRVRLRSATGDGPAPLLAKRADAEGEQDWVVRRIGALREAGVELQETAILYRTNAQSEGWEEALGAAGIPYELRGDEAFFARRHVRQAITVLEAARRQEEAADPTDDPLVALDGAEPARPSLDRLLPRILRERMSWTERAPEGERARARWDDLSVLVELARELAEDEPDADLAAFLADLRRRADLGRSPDGGGVKLLTLHRAKGLEFDAVFLVSVEEGRLPISHAVAHDERLGLRVSDPGSAVAEEGRLLYVGLTRARRFLHVTWRQGRGRRPSRFLYDIGEGAPTRARPADGAPTRARPADGAGTRGGTSASSSTADGDSPLSDAQQAIFERLREWRLERALGDGVPAYVVFPDSTLRRLARDLPADDRALLAVPGIGPTKLERYGADVLGVLRGVRAGRDVGG